MSDKLIEIAKECGADFSMILLPSGNTRYVEFNEAQLHAYTEQVCRQMVEALKPLADMAVHFPVDGTFGNRPTTGDIYACVDKHGEYSITVEHLQAAVNALAAHKEMMVDRHE